MVEALTHDIRSFVSYALAIGPTATIHNHKTNELIEFKFDERRTLGDLELASLERLVEKYGKISRHLPQGKSLDALDIHTSRPAVTFEPGTHYRIISIDAEQLRLAKDIAARVAQVHEAHTAGNHDDARHSYDSLVDYVSTERRAFLGDLKDIPEIDSVIGSHAVGRSGDPHAMNGGAVIFVIAEIFIM